MADDDALLWFLWAGERERGDFPSADGGDDEWWLIKFERWV